MLTKFILHINDSSYELMDDDLRNWSEVKCSYKRANYDGVVRSFTSQFKFVNKAYDLLRDAYLQSQFNTKASIEIQTIDDLWEYHTRFACPFDFSTISWGDHELSLNCVDNSLSSIIKANNSTKYEFRIGDDLKTETPLHFDRVAIQNTAKYYIAGGATTANGSQAFSITNHVEKYAAFYASATEVHINKAVQYSDQPESTEFEDKPVFVIANRDVDVEISYGFELDFVVNGVQFSATGLKDISVMLHQWDRNKNHKHTYQIGSMVDCMKLYYGARSVLPEPAAVGTYCWYNGSIWVRVWDVEQAKEVWVNTEMNLADYKRSRLADNLHSMTLHLSAGDSLSLSIRSELKDEYINNGSYTYLSNSFSVYAQQFNLRWLYREEAIDIDTVSPLHLCQSLIDKMVGESISVKARISDFDPRIANTYLLAAESIRGIDGATLYASFSDFASWMETVFGYIYTIGESIENTNPFAHISTIDFTNDWLTVIELVDEYAIPTEAAQITLYKTSPRGPVCVLYVGDDENSPKRYTKWPGSDAYNDPETNTAREDVLFKTRYAGIGYRVVDGHVEEYDRIDNDPVSQEVNFIHRSELFSADGASRCIIGATDAKYSVKNSLIYSTVTIGYEQKEYENINGRNEFNFNSTYTTGCTSADKPLQLLSKFRADCYGIEFTAQKRGAGTTDSGSDQDVFFVLCERNDGNLVPDRRLEVKNTLTDTIFNGAFTPMACVLANAGFIGIQSKEITLSFASSTGNSNIVISNVPLNRDIVLNNPIATCGEFSFSSDEIEEPDNFNELIEVHSDGVIYRGYINEVDFKYAHSEVAKYKLIVKDIEV